MRKKIKTKRKFHHINDIKAKPTVELSKLDHYLYEDGRFKGNEPKPFFIHEQGYTKLYIRFHGHDQILAQFDESGLSKEEIKEYSKQEFERFKARLYY